MRFGPQVKHETVGGHPVRMEIDSFGIGKSQKTFYPDSQKYVRLQEEVFVLNNVITKIAKVFSNANFTAGEKETSALLAKIQNPNLTQSQEEFLKEFAIYIMSTGCTAVWKRYQSFGNFSTMELINLNPDVTDIDGDKVYTEVDGKGYDIMLSDVIVFYDIRRKSVGSKAYSRIKPLRTQIENIMNAQKAKGIQIENSGTTIVSPKVSSMANNTDEGLNAPVPQMGGALKSQKEEMEERLNSNGIENRIIVSSKGVDAKNLSAELNAVKFHEMVETDILAVYDAFGFPIELSPYGKNVTYENKQVAELSLIEGEVLPLGKSLARSLELEFPNQGKLQIDFNHLNSMSIIQKRIQETNGTTIDQYGYLMEKEVITKEEYKKLLQSKQILT